MSTSLAEQLQRLARPQTSTLDRGKTRASLLFDPKEAAGLRKETVFEIGLDGLEELISKDEVFEEFSHSLYSLSAVDFERSVQSAQDNQKLDKELRKFMLLLSPYFRLHCSYKALEWLIYRFSIHEYNREDLLMLILPYHESNIFVRVLQLVKIKEENDPWFFLKSLQKPGVHLPKQSLFNHAANDPFFIKFVSTFILEIVKVQKKISSLTVAFNFYCLVFTGAIEYSKEVSEPIVSQMLPSLMKGLNSNIPDYRAASYVITARLLSKCTLSPIILDKIMQKISKHKVDSLREEAILVYLVLYQSQVTYKNIPDNALAEITVHDWCPSILQELNSGGSLIYPFLEVLVMCLFKNGITAEGLQFRKFLVNLINQLSIDEEYLPAFINVLIDSVPLKLKKLSEEVQAWISEVIEIIERQYPSQFDKQVYQILVSVKDNERKRKLKQVLKAALTLKRKFDIFEKLYHPNALIRTEAMKFISTNFVTLRGMEKDMLTISLVDRLSDEDVEVVKEALSLVVNTKAIQNDKLQPILIKLLNKYYKDKTYWDQIIEKVIKLLCISENSENLDVILNIIPLLLPMKKHEMVIAKLVIQTQLFSKCALFKTFNVNRKFENVGDFPNELFKCLKSTKNSDILRGWLNEINEKDYDRYTPLQRYSAALLISNLNENTLLSDILPFLEFLEKCFKKLKSKSVLQVNSILNNLKLCKTENLPVNGFLDCVQNIVGKINKLEIGQINFLSSDVISKFFLSVTAILYHDKDIYAEYIEQFNNSIFINHLSKIVFMLHLAVFRRIEGNELPNEILNILYREIKKPNTCIDFNEEIISYILILMNSSDTEIRKKIFLICAEISKLNNDQKSSFPYLLTSLLDHQEEILLDANQLPPMLSKIVKQKNMSAKIEAEILGPLVNLSCNRNIPLYTIVGILEVLSEINSFDIFERTSVLAHEILEKNVTKFDYHESMIIAKNIKRFDGSVGKYLKLQDNITKFLILVLKNDSECLCLDEEINSPSLMLLDKLFLPFISSLSDDLQFLILDIIIEMSTISENPNILLASNKLFKHIDLDVKQILPHLIKMKDVQSQRLEGLKRKRRVSIIPNIDILETIEWRKGIRVLELIQNKKKISNISSMIPVIFEILKKCLDFDEQAAVEYPKQLLLSLILHSCKNLQSEKIPDNYFNMESIVQCIRASSNPQTHHHALLVLSYCASIIPTQVLHHIMAIFTFMGSSVLRHDDAYSFQLISNIIDTVIPILVSNGNKDKIISVLKVFVDVLLDVPEHRRIVLYSQLLERIDPKEHLYLLMLLIFVSHVLHSNRDKIKTPKHKFEDSSTMKRVDIAVSLANQFSPDVVFISCANLIQYIKELPIEREDLENDELQIDLINFTPKQFRHFKYTILIFMNALISSKEFVSKVALLEDEILENLEPLYKDLIVNILFFIQKINPVVDKYINSNQAQYWKAIQHQNLEILDGVNALLTTDMFLLVIKGLMTHSLSTIRKRALDLLNSKLQSSSSFIEECKAEQLYDLVNPLLAIIDKIKTEENEEDHVVIQTALLSLKLIIKHNGSEDPDKYVIVLEFITNIIKSEKPHGNVMASVILCLAELCVTLRSKAIHSFPVFMPVLLKIMKQQKYQDCPTLLCLSLLAVIMKILESLSLFISPYLKKLLSEICQFTTKWENLTEDQKLLPFIHKLKSIKQKLGEMLAPRVLIPAIKNCYTDLLEKNKINAIGPLMCILSEKLTHMTGLEITSYLYELNDFFLNALEFRMSGRCDIEQTNIVEQQIIDALSSFVLKLSESSFRPLYFKLYDWAEKGEKNEKIITFYNVSCNLAKHLKSLFVLFSGCFICNAAQILDSCNKVKTDSLYFDDKEKCAILLEKVIETLLYVFKYVTVKFINRERFEILMQPLIDQLENDFNGIENLIARNDKLLTPCIVHFTIATADDALWKQMNYQILLKMRSTNSHIRLMSLKCLTEIVKHLGEDFLPLLPETIPFLSELLEDEDESVEKNCKKAIQEMEKVLGESLQKYF
ncbi:hypothetical protein WA026_000833 [Henosepilachna vigintioctopunctata]|uniref:HEAT repeat-containing protein 1 n=1 Tax=Henosepilachna vigintioctopunctata TaxID=420089 RepID=A0AAW1V5E2_9CUCU